MKNLNRTDLESIYCDCISAFEQVLSWKWDSRFETMLAEFSISSGEKVREILKRYLSMTWDETSIKNAPENILQVSSYLGGIMPGQFLFTTETSQSLIFCAWWPWGDGNTISIRVAPFFHPSDDTGKAEIINQVRAGLGV